MLAAVTATTAAVLSPIVMALLTLAAALRDSTAAFDEAQVQYNGFFMF